MLCSFPEISTVHRFHLQVWSYLEKNGFERFGRGG